VKVVSVNPEVMSGEPVFAGTRVPVRILGDYLRHNRTVRDFLAQYPTVSEELALAFLEQAEEALVQKTPRSA
jgi:uncharacterized protein (DUF433 family)